MAADDDGYVYAGSAGGGVWRSSTGGGHWTADQRQAADPDHRRPLPGRQGRLWLGTGEATTNADAYLGSGVYVLSDPHHGTFSQRSRVGGDELESTTIHELRFGAGKVWAATSEGVWSHSTTRLSGPWKLEFAPNPDYLPGHSKANDPDAPYKNITNDIAVDPKDPSKVLLAVGWRSGDDYNGFYAQKNGTWQKVTTGLGDLPTGPGQHRRGHLRRRPPTGRATTRSTSRPSALTNNPDSSLEGIYVSKSGSPFGPWTEDRRLPAARPRPARR